MLNKTEQSDRAPNPRVATRPRARAGRFLSDVPNLRRFDSESWLLESPELMAFGWQRLKRSPDSRSWNLFEATGSNSRAEPRRSGADSPTMTSM